MSEHRNQTADDTTSAAAGPPEAGGLPVENVAPDVDVAALTDTGADEPAPDGGFLAEDFNAEAAAPEPPD